MRTAERELSPERLACVDESLVKYLGVLSSRHPERFVPEPPLSKLCDVAGFVSREVVVARLERLESVGRLIPAKCGQQVGWIFVLGKEWRKAQRQGEGVPAPKADAGGFTGRDLGFLKACGIAAV